MLTVISIKTKWDFVISYLMKNSLIKNSLFYFIGQSGERIVYTIAIPIVVSSLSTEDYGIYGLVLSLINLLPLLISLGYTSALSRLCFDKKDNTRIVSTVAVFLLFCSIITFIISIVILLLNFSYNLIIALAGLIIAFNLFSSIFTGVLLAQEKAFLNSIASAISGFFFLSLLVIAKQSNLLTLINLLEIFLIGRVLFAIFISFNNIKIFKGGFDFKIIKSNLDFSIPFIIHTGSIWFLQLGSRWILTFFTNLEGVGVFTLYTQIANTVVWLVNPINMSLSPRLTKHYVDGGLKELVKFHNKTFSIYFYTGISGTILILISGIIYILYYTNEVYKSHILLFPFILLGFFVQILYFPLTNIKQTFKESKIVASITIKSSAFNLLVGICLIYLFGIWGAAITSMLTYIYLFLSYKYSLKDINISYNISFPINLWRK